MLNKNGLRSGLLLMVVLSFCTVQADGIKDLAQTKLGGKGTVDSINASGSSIVINDKLYELAGDVEVFDVNHRHNASITDIKVGDSVGFKSAALPHPTAPYDQLIDKLWILPSKSR